MNRIVSISSACALVLGYLAGYAMSPRSTVAGQAAQAPPPAGALPPGDYSRMQLAPDQGEPLAWSIDDMRKAHTELVARSKGGQATAANPRELFAPHVTRTHSFIMVHRAAPPTPGSAPSIEIHEGATDIYYIVGGSGTVVVGGDVENRRVTRPGEYGGTLKGGGKAFKLKAGDILNIPPSMAHATIADPAEGMTYVLMKVNVGLYPWSLINGTP
ncbi:MAG TPA: cupin domain-containing protein [Vicinamibacterales bacterium]